MSSFLSSVVTTLPRLAAISFSCTETGIASCGFLRASADKSKLESAERPLNGTQLETYLIKANQPALVTVEAANWPPPRCVPYLAVVLGAFFPFEGEGRLPYGTPGNAAPEDKLTVSFDGSGVLTLSSVSISQSIDLSSFAIDKTFQVFICVRSAKAGEVTLEHYLSGVHAETI